MTMPGSGNIKLSYLSSKIFVDDSSIKNLNNSKVRDWLDVPNGNVSLANSRNIALHLGKTETTQNSPPNKAVQGYDRRVENESFGSRAAVDLRDKLGETCYYLYIKNGGSDSFGGSTQPSASYANVFFKLTDANRTIRVSGNSDRTIRSTFIQGTATLKLSVIASDVNYITGASDYLLTENLNTTSGSTDNQTWQYDVPVSLSKPYITLSFENKQTSPGGFAGGIANIPYMGVELYNVKVELL